MMLSVDMGCNRVCLTGFEACDIVISVKGHVYGSEVNNRIIRGNKLDNLRRLRFIETASFNLNLLNRPGIA